MAEVADRADDGYMPDDGVVRLDLAIPHQLYLPILGLFYLTTSLQMYCQRAYSRPGAGSCCMVAVAGEEACPDNYSS